MEKRFNYFKIACCKLLNEDPKSLRVSRLAIRCIQIEDLGLKTSGTIQELYIRKPLFRLHQLKTKANKGPCFNVLINFYG